MPPKKNLDQPKTEAEIAALPSLRLTMEFDGLTGWAVLGFLQLGLRHEGTQAMAIRAMVERFARSLQKSVAPPGSELCHLAEKGWNFDYELEFPATLGFGPLPPHGGRR